MHTSRYLIVGGLGEPGLAYNLDRARRPRGELPWNLFRRVDDARELVRARAPLTPGAPNEQVA